MQIAEKVYKTFLFVVMSVYKRLEKGHDLHLSIQIRIKIIYVNAWSGIHKTSYDNFLLFYRNQYFKEKQNAPTTSSNV